MKHSAPLYSSLSSSDRPSVQNFMRAMDAKQLLLDAFYPIVYPIRDRKLHHRLLAVLISIAQGAPVDEHSKVRIENGNLELLEHFEFCQRKKFSNTLHSSVKTSLDRSAGLCRVDFGTFTPQTHVAMEGKISHVALVVATAELDFSKHQFVYNMACSYPLPLDGRASVVVEPAVPMNSTLPIVVIAAVQLYQFINGNFYLMGGQSQAIKVLKADNTKPPLLKSVF